MAAAMTFILQLFVVDAAIVLGYLTVVRGWLRRLPR